MSKNMIYVVYPYAEGRYQAVKVPASAGNMRIHQEIANFENNEQKSGRRWATKIEPGSFNIAKVTDADSSIDAIAKAREAGLSYEPKPIVLARYKDDLKKASQAFRNAGRQGSGRVPTSPFDGVFDELFGGKDFKL